MYNGYWEISNIVVMTQMPSVFVCVHACIMTGLVRRTTVCQWCSIFHMDNWH